MSARPSPFALASFALLALAALFPVLTATPYYLGVMALAFVGRCRRRG